MVSRSRILSPLGGACGDHTNAVLGKGSGRRNSFRPRGRDKIGDRESKKKNTMKKQKKVEDTGGVSGASFIETGIYEITPGTNVHLPFLGVPMSFIPETSSLLPTNLHSDTPWLTQGKQREIIDKLTESLHDDNHKIA